MTRGAVCRSDFARRLIAEGFALAVLLTLRRRGVSVPAAAEEKISRCTDMEQLDEWLARALTAETVDDLFG